MDKKKDVVSIQAYEVRPFSKGGDVDVPLDWKMTGMLIIKYDNKNGERNLREECVTNIPPYSYRVNILNKRNVRYEVMLDIGGFHINDFLP